MRIPILVAATLAPLVLVPAVLAQPCQLSWSDEFAGDPFVYWPVTMAMYDDDGPGPHEPALHVGGFFDTVEPSISAIAKWTGNEWLPLGGGIDDINAYVHSMVVFDDDGEGPLAPALFVAGNFYFEGGSTPAILRDGTELRGRLSAVSRIGRKTCLCLTRTARDQDVRRFMPRLTLAKSKTAS